MPYASHEIRKAVWARRRKMAEQPIGRATAMKYGWKAKAEHMSKRAQLLKLAGVLSALGESAARTGMTDLAGAVKAPAQTGIDASIKAAATRYQQQMGDLRVKYPHLFAKQAGMASTKTATTSPAWSKFVGAFKKKREVGKAELVKKAGNMCPKCENDLSACKKCGHTCCAKCGCSACSGKAKQASARGIIGNTLYGALMGHMGESIVRDTAQVGRNLEHKQTLGVLDGLLGRVKDREGELADVSEPAMKKRLGDLLDGRRGSLAEAREGVRGMHEMGRKASDRHYLRPGVGALGGGLAGAAAGVAGHFAEGRARTNQRRMLAGAGTAGVVGLGALAYGRNHDAP